MKRASRFGLALVVGCGLLGAGIGIGQPAATSLAAQAGTASEAVIPSRPYVGKPRPPVEVIVVPGARLESGVPGQLTVQVRAPAGIEGIELAVAGDAGLAILGVREAAVTDRSPRVGAEASAAGARFAISATPMTGGTHAVSGLVRFTVDGVTQAAPFRLPVLVGGPAAPPPVSTRKPAQPPIRDATGELIDSIPTETTVR